MLQVAMANHNIDLFRRKVIKPAKEHGMLLVPGTLTHPPTDNNNVDH